VFQFEHHSMPLLPWPKFLARVAGCGAFGAGVMAVSLAVGISGYHYFEGLGLLDAFENASMLLSGMGPLWSPRTDAGKLFASFYALTSGLLLILVAGITFAPVLHRMMHRLHVKDADAEA
jgi:hypothetical protein